MKRKIIPKQKFRTYATFPLVAGDARAYEIELDLGQSVTGAEFKAVAVRADGKVIEDLGTVTNGIATYTMANSMYAVPGELTVRLQILHNSSVLTDREIVFEVLEGTQNASNGTTVVPLNDSIILRLSGLEEKISGKVDKAEGKDLSQNDFTDEYKAKLDGLDQELGQKLEQANEELNGHKNDQTNPHNVTALQVGAYTKQEVDTKLGNKVNKSDITNVYSYQGSVDTFDDLGVVSAIEFIPDGEPTCNGQVCGSFNENNGVITINEIEDPEDDIIIPIKEITIKKGYYAIYEQDSCGGWYYPAILVDGNWLESWWTYSGGCVFKIENDIAIKEVRICRYGESGFTGFTGDVIGSMVKVQDKWVDESSYNANTGTYQTPNLLDPKKPNGTVYNVLDTGMNYAWNGYEWDALGGEHKDVEARGNILALQQEMGDVKNAVNSKADKLITDELQTAKADKSEVYTKTEINLELDKKANQEDVEQINTELGTKANKSEVYTKTEVNTQLDKKANKSDIVSAYKFQGSVNTFNDLPYKYEIIPDGLPIIHSENAEIDGSVWGTFEEETHKVTVNPVKLDTDTVTIPVVPITIPTGLYWSDENKIGYMNIGQLDTYGCYIAGQIWDNKLEDTINEVSCWTMSIEDNPIGGSASSFILYKLMPNWCFYNSVLNGYEFYGDFPDSAYDNGIVYNVLDTGMNYAWNGYEWDALGGEHKDLEARDSIENLENEVGDIETALDSIIEIQNSLIGGDSV